MCQHHYVLEKADGPVSVGVCKFCAVIKEFKNSIPGDQSWFHANTTDEEKELQVETFKARKAHDANDQGLRWV